MELFAKIVHGSKPLTIFGKNSILDVRQGYEYAYENANRLQFLCSNLCLEKLKPKILSINQIAMILYQQYPQKEFILNLGIFLLLLS